MKKLFIKYIVKLIIIHIFILTIMPIIQNKKVYSYWYEEPEVYETENIDSMWWLSRKKKEELKIKQKEEIEKKKKENLHKDIRDKKTKWLYNDLDISDFPKNKWEIIDEDGDFIGYNYYFDKDGYLLIDTITPDYKIVDMQGREVDHNFKPIEYNIDSNIKYSDTGIAVEENDTYIPETISPPNIIITNGVVLKNKEKIYDNSLDKNVLNYIDKSNRFIKNTNCIVFNDIRWKNCSSLKGNGGYVVFNNTKNNFNKITGYISTEYYTDIDNNEDCILKVYDADLYDKYNNANRLYDLEEIYSNSSFFNCEPIRFVFTFDRSVKRLRFEIETLENKKSLICFLKDLKYGFSKKAFYEELIRKKEEQEEIEELKRLGIYVEDMWSFDTIDENGDEIDEEETEHVNENNDDRIGGIFYVSDEETRNYEDVVRDRTTGPAFDENLKNIKEVGPSQN